MSEQNATQVGPSTIIAGEVRSADPLVILGRVEGGVVGASTVTVASGAVVRGNIEGTDVSVDGYVAGDVTCTGRLEIGSHGRLIGDIRAGGLVVRDGGAFRGQVNMTHTASTWGEEPPPPPMVPRSSMEMVVKSPPPASELSPPDDVAGVEPGEEEDDAEVLSLDHRVHPSSSGAEEPPSAEEPALLTQRPIMTTEERIEAALLRRNQGGKG